MLKLIVYFTVNCFINLFVLGKYEKMRLASITLSGFKKRFYHAEVLALR